MDERNGTWTNGVFPARFTERLREAGGIVAPKSEVKFVDIRKNTGGEGGHLDHN